MKSLIGSTIKARGLIASIAMVTLVAGASAQKGQGNRVGNPYTPNGADYTITGVQNVDDSNPGGQILSGTQVNTNFEMTPSIGVTYQNVNGGLVDFGLGLYTDNGKGGKGGGGSAESTGLRIDYNTAVDANTSTVTLEDFDIKDKSKGFNTGKVEPAMVIFGVTGGVLATATPGQVLNAMTQVQGQDDVWDVNIGHLLAADGITGQAVKSVLLYADAKNGEKTNSDPYLLRSAGNGTPVPEPGSIFALGAGALFLIRRAKKKA